MIREINVIKLKERLDHNEKFIFIDCRELAEWNEERIEGTTLIPLSEFEQKYLSQLPDKNAEIVIHCKAGRRSMNACMFLMQKGYTNLTNVEGGITAWTNAGLPTK